MSREFKKVLLELKPHKRKIISIAIAGVIMSVLQGLIAAGFKDLMDNMGKPDVIEIWKTPLALLSVYFFMGWARYYHIFNMNYTSELVVQSLRERLQSKFMKLNLSFHNNYAAGSGGLISRILNDVQVIQNGLRLVADFFREPILFIILLGNLFKLNWRLTSTVIIALPIIIFFIRQITKTVKKYSHKGQEELEKITSTIKESLDGVRTIQSFNLEQTLTDRFRQESQEYLYSRKKIHSRVELSGPVTEFIAAAVILSIVMAMSYEISQGRATFGDFASYIASLLMLNAPIKKIQESSVKFQETLVSFKRIYSILDEDSEVHEKPGAIAFPSQWSKIEFKNINFSYGSEHILKNISLTINKGESIALVGSSGSGKSSLVNLLPRFFDPSSGNILVDGKSIFDFSLKSLRNNIALVSQDVFLFNDTIENNIWSGNFNKDKALVKEAATNANAVTFIEKNPEGFQYEVGDRGNLLSGGEKQRISIARAFFKDAPILILDEATSALDSVSESEVQKGLDRLLTGKTSLVIAHRFSTISKANRILVLKSGSVIEEGSHESLLAKQGEYFMLFQLQKGV